MRVFAILAIPGLIWLLADLITSMKDSGYEKPY